MRIIGGKFKKKKLVLPINKETRPLRDLVKESIFNLIKHSKNLDIEIENSNILDLFAGSGSFGLEAISQGANKVYFFENSINALDVLEKNINNLKATNNSLIFRKNCFEFFESNEVLDIKFDVVFVDPPYKEKKINHFINSILKKKLLKKKGIIIIHRHKKDLIELTNNLNIIDNRIYGISKIIIGN